MVQAADPRPIVTITGISGYIASHVGLLLLQDGSYRVRGTVRDKSKPVKIDPLRKAYGELFSQLELVEADLLDSDSMATAISGSTYVIHMASPFVIEAPRDENELIRPAVDGTLAVMRACHKDRVQRVCVTSSVVSITECRPELAPDVFNESHWSDPNMPSIGAYEKSKTMAERAAWDFVESLPEDERFTLTTVNPGFVLGPTLVNAGFTSGKFISMFMENNLPGGVPRVQLACVDVRDVAQAHIECIKRDEAQGKRFILGAQSLWLREIADILHRHFAGMGYRIPQSNACYCLVRTIGFCRQDAKKIASQWGRTVNCDNTRSKTVLGIEYHDLNETLREMGISMMDQGIIADRRKTADESRTGLNQ